jgi:hypothetical protein
VPASLHEAPASADADIDAVLPLVPPLLLLAEPWLLLTEPWLLLAEPWLLLAELGVLLELPPSPAEAALSLLFEHAYVAAGAIAVAIAPASLGFHMTFLLTRAEGVERLGRSQPPRRLCYAVAYDGVSPSAWTGGGLTLAPGP